MSKQQQYVSPLHIFSLSYTYMLLNLCWCDYQATYYGAYTKGGACTLDPTPFAGMSLMQEVGRVEEKQVVNGTNEFCRL